MKYWPVLILTLLLVAAVCTEKEAQEYLAEGTDFVFPDRKPVDYVLILDRSGSMRGAKLDQAKQAAVQLVDQFTNKDRAAVVTFDSRSTIVQAFTKDKDTLKNSILKIKAGDFTKYSAALEDAGELLQGDNRHVVIFLSDGEPDEDTQQIVTMVEQMAKDEVCMFTIAYTEDIQEGAQVILEEMADISITHTNCGSYHTASENTKDLEEIFTQIYAEISSEGLINVTATVVEDGEDSEQVALQIETTSALNNKDLYTAGCFLPTARITIKQGTNIVLQEETTERLLPLDLGFGAYTYEIFVEETCGGDCFFTGKSEGEIALIRNPELCKSSWTQLNTILTDQKPVEVRVTATGLQPRTVTTEGIIVWHNVDTKPHKIATENEAFIIPELAPGERYTSYIPSGTHIIHNVDRELIGLVDNDAVYAHEPVDLILIADKSGSMAGKPLETAKRAANNLLSVLLPKDRVSLIVFSDKAQTVNELSSDIQRVRAGVDGLLSGGSTFYIPPLVEAGKQINKRGGNERKVAIFLSDGAPFDDGGANAILASVDTAIGDACLYTIGYGEESRAAEELLRGMSTLIREKNSCGQFIFASTAEGELSKVLGEIYAQTQEERLEIYDVAYTRIDKEHLEITASVRSKTNKLLLPAATEHGCVPPAKMDIEIEGSKYTFDREDHTYTVTVPLRKGVYEGRILARVSPFDEPARLAIGTYNLTVSEKSTWWIYALAGLFIVIIAYVFIRARRTPTNAY